MKRVVFFLFFGFIFYSNTVFGNALFINNTNFEIRVFCDQEGLFLNEILKPNDQLLFPSEFEDKRKDIENGTENEDGFEVGFSLLIDDHIFIFYLNYMQDIWPLSISRVRIIREYNQVVVLVLYFESLQNRGHWDRIFWF